MTCVLVFLGIISIYIYITHIYIIYIYMISFDHDDHLAWDQFRSDFRHPKSSHDFWTPRILLAGCGCITASP